MGGVVSDVGCKHALRWCRAPLRRNHDARHRTPRTRAAVPKRSRRRWCPGLGPDPRSAERSVDADASEHHVASTLDRGAAPMMKLSLPFGALCLAALMAAACGGRD